MENQPSTDKVSPATPRPVDMSTMSYEDRVKFMVGEMRSVADAIENGTAKLEDGRGGPEFIKGKGKQPPKFTGRWYMIVLYSNIVKTEEKKDESAAI